MQEVEYFRALVRMFDQAIKLAVTLPPGQRDAFVVRLELVRQVSHNLGYGVGEDMDLLFEEYSVGEG